MTTDPNEALRALRQGWVEHARTRVEEAAAALDRLDAAATDDDARRDLARLLHGLAGAGTTYGYPMVTQVAQGVEREARDLGQAPVDLACRGRWREALASLRRALAGEASTDAGSAPLADLLLATDDGALPGPLILRAEADGYHVLTVTSVSALRAALQVRLPQAIVIDRRLAGDATLALVSELRSRPGGDVVAILVVGPMADFPQKVEAAHSGADGSFDLPLDADALMRRLQQLAERHRAAPGRVLVVEDEPYHTAFARSVLESAGYVVHICEDPAAFERELGAFDPDLVLMDVALPGTSGYDLVRFLRQDARHATLPVLYLTGMTTVDDRIEGARAGGDDYLVKPVSPALLLTTVAARIERARFLRSLVERDGLTRLLTHTAFLERARAVVAQKGRRAERNTAWVMLDLDHFKAVNDRYGHPVGDRVLTALASLLRQRLRQADTIGRYGGEEFAILLDDLDESEALRLMARLREQFAALSHTAPGAEPFRCTFSAGVAELPPGMDLDLWRQAADDALYAAKANGRNRVRGASGQEIAG